MELAREFESSAERVSSGQVQGICNHDLLSLYGLFSVVRKGIPPADGPSPYLDPRGSAKWVAWKKASVLTPYVVYKNWPPLLFLPCVAMNFFLQKSSDISCCCTIL
jgi:acyl-CoA-binding protein